MKFASAGSRRKKMHFAVVGGVHGNELVGMEGAACIADFFGARGGDKSGAKATGAKATGAKARSKSSDKSASLGSCVIYPGELTLGVRSRRLRDAILRSVNVTVVPCANTVNTNPNPRPNPNTNANPNTNTNTNPNPVV